MKITKLAILGSLFVVAALAAPPAAAQGTHVKIYGSAAYVAPLSESDVTVGSITDAVKNEKQVGWNFGIEGRLGKIFGIELDYVRANQDVQFAGTTVGSTNFSPLSLTLNFHLIHSTIVDFYFGPSYSYVNWGDIHLNGAGQGLFTTTGLGTDSSNAWGVATGLDIGLGKHFAFSAGLRYIDTQMQIQNGPGIDVNPLVARVGVAVRF